MFSDTRTSFLGNLISHADTNIECRDACTGDDVCEGYDFKTLANLCYHHVERDHLDFTQEDDNYDHYVKQECGKFGGNVLHEF